MAVKSLSDMLRGVTRFGRLTVISEAEPYHNAKSGRDYRMALCRCDCGKEKRISPSKLVHGVIVSCGCYAAEQARENKRTHGLTGSPEWMSWTSMKSRCLNQNAQGYENYGGRGITVCDRWRDSFEAFYEDMGPRPSLGHSIERNDTNGHYEPRNCRWATSLEQGANKRNNQIVELRGEKMTLAEACRQSPLSRNSIIDRLDRGMSVEDALFAPIDTSQGSRAKSNNRFIEFQGERMLLIELAERTGIDHGHIGYHLKRGRTADEAVAFILAARMADRSKCPKGHSLEGENLYIAPKGGRQCRTCRSESRAKSRAKVKGIAA